MRTRLISLCVAPLAATMAFSNSAMGARPFAVATPGTYSCKIATAANQIKPPPPLWELSGKRPTVEETAASEATQTLCPEGEVPSAFETTHKGVADVVAPGHATTTGTGLGGATFTPPSYKGEGCKNGGCYWYAESEVQQKAIGMEYVTNVSEPQVSAFPAAHSIDQLALGAGAGLNTDTIETGWDVDPDMWPAKPDKPHLFVFINKDEYKGECEISGQCYDDERYWTALEGVKITMGEALEPSTKNFVIGVEGFEGNWWIWAGNEWIGYVSGSFWEGKFTHAESEANYGEVWDSEEAPTTAMGNGEFGGSPAATPMTAPVVILSHNLEDTTELKASVTNSSLYSIGDINKGRTEWHFGGPGIDPSAPWVATGAANDIGIFEATLNGEIDPNNLATKYYFEWGPTGSYGNYAPSAEGGKLAAGSEVHDVSAKIAGLQPGMEYQYRLVASNSDGTSYGTGSALKTDAPVGLINSSSGALYSPEPLAIQWKTVSPTTNHPSLISVGGFGTGYIDNTGAYWSKEPQTVGVTELSGASAAPTALSVSGTAVGLINVSGANYSPEPLSVQWKTISPSSNHPLVISVSGTAVGYIDSTGAYWSRDAATEAFTKLCGAEAKPTALSVSGTAVGLINVSGANYSPEPLSVQWKTISPATDRPSVVSVGKGGAGYIDSTGAYWSKEPQATEFTELSKAADKPAAISVDGSSVGLINTYGSYWSPEPITHGWTELSAHSAEPKGISVG